ncbi:MAG: selenium cofactor biosynthesis protein YqeC [Halobacteriales archaeon]
MDLVDALAARGLVAVVGAGGKKTTLYALAERFDRALVTATVRIPIFDAHVSHVAVTDDPATAVEDAERDDWPLGVVPERDRKNRYRGYETLVVDGLADDVLGGSRSTGRGSADAVGDPVDSILADGARNRRLKAPDEREPRIPATADTVLPIASARVVGKPLTDDRVHRVDRVASITDRAEGDRIEAADVAAVLASTEGGLKDVPADATVVPVVNMVDTPELAAVAREVAAGIFDRTDRVDRVALTRMDRGEAVDVVER